jgi:DNA-binding Lrp family transcriptional regulator
MTIGYVLIKTKPGHERDVYYDLYEMKGIKEVQPLVGRYDLIVKIEAKDHDDLGYVLLNQINHIKHIHDTEMLTATQF